METRKNSEEDEQQGQQKQQGQLTNHFTVFEIGTLVERRIDDKWFEAW